MENDDIFDSVDGIEKGAFDQGFQEGILDADQNIFQDGIQAGVMKGLSVGLEVGFYDFASEILIQDHQNEELKSGIHHTRARLIHKFQSKLKNFPNYNETSFDFEQEIRDIRVLYSTIGEPIGKFKPESIRKKESNSSEW